MEPGLFILQPGEFRERRVSRAFTIDPLAQRTFVVETDLCRTQAAVIFGQVVAPLALSLAVCADGFVKIHLRSPKARHRPFRDIGRNERKDQSMWP